MISSAVALDMMSYLTLFQAVETSKICSYFIFGTFCISYFLKELFNKHNYDICVKNHSTLIYRFRYSITIIQQKQTNRVRYNFPVLRGMFHSILVKDFIYKVRN